MKAFLGMGLLGANFVRAMLKKGDQVQVWNRTAAKAAELEQYGAKAFANAVDAVKGAEIVHLTLKDDASVDEVLAAAAPGVAAEIQTVTGDRATAESARRWRCARCPAAACGRAPR